MRYTEARLARVASDSLLDDIDKETVDFQPNYDETTSEPVVLPARFPNLLVNGAGGIAVGMATNIPPTTWARSSTPAVPDSTIPCRISIDELIDIVPGPDFPTGGIILGQAGCRSAYAQGPRLRRHARPVTEIEEMGKDRSRPSSSPRCPIQVNKASMASKRSAELVAREDHRRHLRSATMSQTARACAWWSRSGDHQADDRPQSAVPLYAAADQLRRQHAGDQRRPPRH